MEVCSIFKVLGGFGGGRGWLVFEVGKGFTWLWPVEEY